jgi:hypothetical protein
MKQLKGACLCGAVEYTIPDALRYAGYCHCSECRRFSGSASSAFGGIPKERFRLLKGEHAIRHYAKSAATVLAFCGTCGSSLYADKPQRGLLHLRLGSLLDEPSLAPQAHAHVASKAAWHEIGDDLPRFDGPSNLSQRAAAAG